jgi:hypothetical protein
MCHEAHFPQNNHYVGLRGTPKIGVDLTRETCDLFTVGLQQPFVFFNTMEQKQKHNVYALF